MAFMDKSDDGLIPGVIPMLSDEERLEARVAALEAKLATDAGNWIVPVYNEIMKAIRDHKVDKPVTESVGHPQPLGVLLPVEPKPWTPFALSSITAACMPRGDCFIKIPADLVEDKAANACSFTGQTSGKSDSFAGANLGTVKLPAEVSQAEFDEWYRERGEKYLMDWYGIKPV